MKYAVMLVPEGKFAEDCTELANVEMPAISESYTEKNGNCCPNCSESDDIVPTSSEDGETLVMTKGVRCDKCGATWEDVFVLVGLQNLEVPTNWRPKVA